VRLYFVHISICFLLFAKFQSHLSSNLDHSRSVDFRTYTSENNYRNNISNNLNSIIQDSCKYACYNIDWAKWYPISKYNYKGILKSGKVHIEFDTFTLSVSYPTAILETKVFSPKKIDSILFPIFPVKPKLTKLIHKIYLDSVKNISDLFILVGHFPNSSEPKYTIPQTARLRVYDDFGNQLDLNNICEVFQDRLIDTILAPTKVQLTQNEIIFNVNYFNNQDGSIVVLNNFPNNSHYIEVEHFDEHGTPSEGMLINVGFLDCCDAFGSHEIQLIPCKGENNFYTLQGLKYFQIAPNSGKIKISMDSSKFMIFDPPYIFPLSFNFDSLIPDNNQHCLLFQAEDYPNCYSKVYFNSPTPIESPIIFAKNTFCAKDTMVLYCQNYFYKYKWSGPNNLYSDSMNLVLNNLKENDSGFYFLTVTDSFGCKRDTNIEIIIYSNFDTVIYIIACDSFNFDGLSITKSGVYNLSYLSVNGCDSTIHLHINIPNSNTTPYQLSACDSATINGTTYTRTGMYNQKLISANGCDSTLTIDLNIFTKTAAQIMWAACDSALINGIRYTQSGNYTQLLKNTYQCDSVLDIDLNLSQSTSERQTLSSCDSVLVNGQLYSQSGIYTQLLKNTSQCDSMLTIDFTRLQKTTNNLSYKSCDSAVINGQVYTQSGNYTQSLVNANACDSILNLQLEITKSSSENLSIQQCDSVEVNGQVYTQSGNYTQVLQNAAKCDSVLILNIDILKQTTSTHNQTSCDSVIINNQLYTTTGTFNQVLKNTNGCDSILSLDLLINKSSSGILSQTSCDSAIINNVVYKASGMYTQVLKNTYGCDSTLTLDLSIKPGNPSSLDAGKDTSLCDGDILKLNALFTGTADFTWQSSSGRFDNASQQSTNYYPGSIGSQTVYLRAADDCRQWLDSLQLLVIPKQIISVTGDTIIDPCKEIRFKASGAASYIWTPASHIDCLDPPCSIVKLKSTTATRFTITTQGPCVIPANLNLSLTKIESDIYLPNVFSPNGDNINDLFLPVFNCEQLTFYNLQIFDRWGNLVFETTDKDKGWDGRSNNQMMIPGVYPYVIEYEVHSQGRRFKTGEITLTR
jgi:gliding motility-associated-like protein